jgi:hypothetical protein
MPNPIRPVQDGIIDPVWGQWVHDDRVAGSMSLAMLTPADVAAAANTWAQSATHTIGGAPPGLYLAIAQATIAMSTNTGTAWAGIKRTADPANTNATVVALNMAVGAKITVPILQLITHAGGDLATHITFGNSGGGAQIVLYAQSRLAVVRIGPTP